MRAHRQWVVAALALAITASLPAPAEAEQGSVPSAQRPALRGCDLGLPRPFRCGHISAPMRRADPALGTTKVAFALRLRAERERPSLGTIMAMDGGPGYASTAAPPAGGLEPPVPAGWRAPATFPTLILVGQVDDITSVAEARQVKRRFPRSRLYVVPGRGHVSSLYFPFRSPAVGVIRRFIAAY